MTRRYDDKRSTAARRCLQEVAKVCHTYGFVLGHEDSTGMFIIAKEQQGESHFWLLNAVEEVDESPPS